MKVNKLDKKNYNKAIKLIGTLINSKGSTRRSEHLKEIERLLKESAKSGNYNAMYELGQQYDEFGIFGEDPKKASYWYKKASKLGYCAAMNNLAHNYETGKGVIKSMSIAKKFYMESAMSGDDLAMMNVGIILERKKPKESIAWYEKALKKGNPSAAFELAKIYILNEKVKDLKLGKSYLSKVSDLSEDEKKLFLKLKSKVR